LGCAPQFTTHHSQLTIPSPLTTNNHHSSTLCRRSPCRLADSPTGSPVATCASLPVGTGLWTVHDPIRQSTVLSHLGLRSTADGRRLACRRSTVPLPPRRLADRESRRYLGCAPQCAVHHSQLTIRTPLTTNNHHSSTLCGRSPCRLADSPTGSPVATFCAALHNVQFTIHNSQSAPP